MDSHIVNLEVRLRATLVGTFSTRAGVHFHDLQLVRMFRLHVKVQSLFLEKCLVAMPAFMRIHAGMFLQVVMHGVLALVGRRTMGTYIESLRIFLVGEAICFNGHRHRVGIRANGDGGTHFLSELHL